MSLSTGICEVVCPIPKEADMNNFIEKINFIQSLEDLIRDRPLRPLDITEADIKTLEKEIMVMLREVAG